MRTGSLLAVTLLTAVAIAHLLRFALGLSLTVAGVAIPPWASLFGVLVPGGIAYLLWREGHSGPPSPAGA